MVGSHVLEGLEVLIHGFPLTCSDDSAVKTVIDKLRAHLMRVENKIAAITADSISDKGGFQVQDLISILQHAVFGLGTLPSEFCPLIICTQVQLIHSNLVDLTDGVLSMHDTTGYDGPLMLLNRDDISCFFINVGGSSRSYNCIGDVPDTG